ncbi:MAG: hypothetical protein KF878_09620 [Planctomycetes bacterium]|nr:hypothetical protein [Planctomycetota bacterium]
MAAGYYLLGSWAILLLLGLMLKDDRTRAGPPPPPEFGADLERILKLGSCVCVFEHEGQHWFLDDDASSDAILAGRHDSVRGAYVVPSLSRRRAMKVAEMIGATFLIHDVCD